MLRTKLQDLIFQFQTWHQDEQGASLVELLVAISISVLVIGVITTSLVQFLLVTDWGKDQLLISNDLQVAATWLGRDALEAASFSPGSGNVYGTLNWDNLDHQYRYSYDSSQNTLVREHLQSGVVQSTQNVARHIAAQGDVTFNLNGHLLTVTITSTSGGESESITLHLALRSH